MRLNQREQFSVRIVRSEGLDQLLTEELDRPSDVLLQSLQSSYRMKVQVRGTDGLVLQPLSEEIQIVGTEVFSEWQYVVEARQGGRQTIWVSVNALLGGVGGSTDSIISLPVLHKQVDVDVGALERSRQFVTTHWKWLIGTALGLSGAIVAWIGLLTP